MVTVATVMFSSWMLQALFGLDRLVQALGPAPAFHLATGELVHDVHLAVLDDVLDIAVVQLLGLDRLDQVVHQLAVLGGVQVVDPKRLLDLGTPSSVGAAVCIFSSTS